MYRVVVLRLYTLERERVSLAARSRPRDGRKRLLRILTVTGPSFCESHFTPAAIALSPSQATSATAAAAAAVTVYLRVFARRRTYVR